MADAIYTPDRAIVAKLQRIEPLLSVAMVATPRGQRWAVLHDVDPVGGLEATIERMVQVLSTIFARAGYVKDRTDLGVMARDAVRGQKIVFYVTEEDGSFRPLDDRVVQRIEEMDWFRRNFDIKDWQELLRFKRDEMTSRAMRAQDDLWDTMRRDRVFRSQVSDILRGLRPVRSVYVQRPDQGEVMACG